MKILLICPNARPANTYARMIEELSADVRFATDIADALLIIQDFDVDITFIDSPSPESEPADMVATLRGARASAPVVVFYDRTDRLTLVRALNFGADDVVDKASGLDLQLARVRAVLRRAPNIGEDLIEIGPLKLDRLQKIATIADEQISLTNREYDILELLCRRKGTILSKEAVIQHLYNDVDAPGRKAIEVFICKLRKKLSDASNGGKFIETHWGQGYVLQDPVFPKRTAMSA